ncbi:MAG TPA: hypothetical protein VFP33_02665 [Gallionella sp.]|nr:hypothetical protein [Gallionella sp.]
MKKTDPVDYFPSKTRSSAFLPTPVSFIGTFGFQAPQNKRHVAVPSVFSMGSSLVFVTVVVIVLATFFVVILPLHRNRLYDGLWGGTAADRRACTAADGCANNGTVLATHALTYRSACCAAEHATEHRAAVDGIGIETSGKNQNGC